MSNIQIFTQTGSDVDLSLGMPTFGGYLVPRAGSQPQVNSALPCVFADAPVGAERHVAAGDTKQHPGTLVWSPPT